MEHIKISLKQKESENITLPILNFKTMYEYWLGSIPLIPITLKNMDIVDYKSNKCLTWYEKQVENHDRVMSEFRRIWLKK